MQLKFNSGYEYLTIIPEGENQPKYGVKDIMLLCCDIPGYLSPGTPRENGEFAGCGYWTIKKQYFTKAMMRWFRKTEPLKYYPPDLDRLLSINGQVPLKYAGAYTFEDYPVFRVFLTPANGYYTINSKIIDYLLRNIPGVQLYAQESGYNRLGHGMPIQLRIGQDIIGFVGPGRLCEDELLDPEQYPKQETV